MASWGVCARVNLRRTGPTGEGRFKPGARDRLCSRCPVGGWWGRDWFVFWVRLPIGRMVCMPRGSEGVNQRSQVGYGGFWTVLHTKVCRACETSLRHAILAERASGTFRSTNRRSKLTAGRRTSLATRPAARTVPGRKPPVVCVSVRQNRVPTPERNTHTSTRTWTIGGKPADPHDPGPYGSPGWYQDRRIGRHRRGELPDPLPHSPSETPDRFDPLRESAWDDFMTDSESLAAAHREPPGRFRRQSAFECEAGGALMLWIRLFQWLLSVIKSLSDPPETERTPQPAPARRPRPFPTHAPTSSGHARRSDGVRSSAAMARALAGAQRARAGVVSWV